MPVVNQITKTFIDNTPNPEKGQIPYWERKQSGFGIIFGMKAKTFVVQKDIRGKTVRYTIGRYGHFTPEEARKIAKEKLYQMALGKNPNEEEKQQRHANITLRAVLKDYCNTRKSLKDRTKHDYKYYMEKYLKDWLGVPMAEIDKEAVLERHTFIGKKHGKLVANKAMRILRCLFNFTETTYNICEVNPVAHLSKIRAWYPEKRRLTFIKPHQLKAWFQAVLALENDTMRDYLLLLLFTGLRRNEAAKLKWENVDFTDRTFTITDTKNNDPLTLPMSDYLYELFEARRKRYGNGVYVFPGPGKNGYLAEPKKAVYKVVVQSGVCFSCHDLRRSFATYGEGLDLPYLAMKRLLNHRTHDITARYVILDVERLRQPMQAITDYILEQVK